MQCLVTDYAILDGYLVTLDVVDVDDDNERRYSVVVHALAAYVIIDWLNEAAADGHGLDAYPEVLEIPEWLLHPPRVTSPLVDA